MKLELSIDSVTYGCIRCEIESELASDPSQLVDIAVKAIETEVNRIHGLNYGS